MSLLIILLREKSLLMTLIYENIILDDFPIRNVIVDNFILSLWMMIYKNLIVDDYSSDRYYYYLFTNCSVITNSVKQCNRWWLFYTKISFLNNFPCEEVIVEDFPIQKCHYWLFSFAKIHQKYHFWWIYYTKCHFWRIFDTIRS